MKTKYKVFFDPLTDNQHRMIFYLLDEYSLSLNFVHNMISDLTGFSSIKMLSKNEASYIIDWLQDNKPANKPKPLFLKHDNKDYALMWHIEQIRDMARIMNWDETKLFDWFYDNFEITHLRDFDRKKGNEVFKKIIGIHTYKLKGYIK